MAFKENLNASVYVNVLLISCMCFLFSEVMDQMFLKVRGPVQGSFRSPMLGIASVFVHVDSRPGSGGGGGVPPRFFYSMLI